MKIFAQDRGEMFQRPLEVQVLGRTAGGAQADSEELVVSHEVADGADRPPAAEGAHDAPDLQGPDLAALGQVLEQEGGGAEDSQQRTSRLAVDAKIVNRLRLDGFQGPRYQRLLSGLMEYGWTTLLKWSASGEIFRRSREAGRPVRASLIVADWSADDRALVVTESVIAGERIFRTHGLIAGRWSPEGGASLTTYFVGAALRGFRTEYIRWHRDRQLDSGNSAEDSEAMNAIPDQRAVDPCHAAIIRSEVDALLPFLAADPKLREGLLLRAAGHTQQQAAEKVGLSEKALEGRVGRLRTKIQNHRETTLESAEGGQ